MLSGCLSVDETTDSNAGYQISDTYIGLRELAFKSYAEELKKNASYGPETYGVIMDVGLSKGIATIASFRTGDASLYGSGGGAILGGINHKNVADASKEFVNVSGSYVQYMEKVSDYPLPQKGEIIFYVLTRDGVYMGKDTDTNLSEGKSRFSPLFVAGNNLITEIRKTTS